MAAPVWCGVRRAHHDHRHPTATPSRQRRGTPLWLPRCGVGYAERTIPPDIAQYAGNRHAATAISGDPNPNLPPSRGKGLFARPDRNASAESIARGSARRCVRRTPPRTGAATRACPYGCGPPLYFPRIARETLDARRCPPRLQSYGRSPIQRRVSQNESARWVLGATFWRCDHQSQCETLEAGRKMCAPRIISR